MPSPDGRLRVGVAGVGSLGYHHARILRDLPDVRMSGFFDVDPTRTAKVESELGLSPASSLEALLDDVDALVVAVPTNAHEEVAGAALSRGVHLLVEKPIAPSLEAADRMLEAAAEHGCVVQIGHVERFNAALQAAEPYLERPLFIESHRMAPFVPRGTDVAVVLDLMIHDVDLVQSLVGEAIDEISATGIPVLTPSVDIANARLTFANGAVANLTASRISQERLRKLRIFQRSGYLSLNLADGTGEFLRLRGELPAFGEGELPIGPGGAAGLADLVERIPLEGPRVEPLRRELESFRDAVLGLRAPAVSGADGRNALAITLAIEELILRHVADTRPA